VVLTFDDGFENFYTNAFPTLQTHHLPAVVFVVTGWVGKNGYLTWEQIRQLDQEGITIGSHSVTHPWLPALSDVELKRELQASKRILEGKLGHPVDLFCYPMGAFDERVRKAVIDAGYRGARATNPGKAASNRDPYALKRVRISRSSDSLLTFWVESSGYYLGFKEK
jgi:peptidoglycan/xylan/chitin deacetylase (PgdA/CDA1 family)